MVSIAKDTGDFSFSNFQTAMSPFSLVETSLKIEYNTCSLWAVLMTRLIFPSPVEGTVKVSMIGDDYLPLHFLY